MVHEGVRAAQEECPSVAAVEVVDDHFPVKVAGRAGPTARRFRGNYDWLKTREMPLTILEFPIKDDVALRTHAAKERRFRIQAQVIDVSEHRLFESADKAPV